MMVISLIFCEDESSQTQKNILCFFQKNNFLEKRCIFFLTPFSKVCILNKNNK